MPNIELGAGGREQLPLTVYVWVVVFFEEPGIPRNRIPMKNLWPFPRLPNGSGVHPIPGDSIRDLFGMVSSQRLLVTST